MSGYCSDRKKKGKKQDWPSGLVERVTATDRRPLDSLSENRNMRYFLEYQIVAAVAIMRTIPAMRIRCSGELTGSALLDAACHGTAT
jgi:hypothetical protein